MNLPNKFLPSIPFLAAIFHRTLLSFSCQNNSSFLPDTLEKLSTTQTTKATYSLTRLVEESSTKF